MVALNRCLVLGETEGYKKAIEELLKMKVLSENCHYNTSLGEMYLRDGNKAEAKNYFNKALSLTTSKPETELIQKKIRMSL